MRPFFQRIKGSEIAKTMSIIVAVVGIVMGLAVGASAGDEVNFFGVISIWIPAALVTMCFLLCYCHFKNQEEMKKSLDKIARSLGKENADEEEFEYLED